MSRLVRSRDPRKAAGPLRRFKVRLERTSYKTVHIRATSWKEADRMAEDMAGDTWEVDKIEEVTK